MSEKRIVKWFEYKHKIENGKSFYDKELKGEALFHTWGIDYEELDRGVGNFSTAIIELPDGQIKLIPAENITFK